MENLAKAGLRAAAGQVVGARAVVVTVEASSAELEGGPAVVAVKAAISAPLLARMVAGTAWEGTEAAVEARRAARSALGRSRAEPLFAPTWRPSGRGVTAAYRSLISRQTKKVLGGL